MPITAMLKDRTLPRKGKEYAVVLNEQDRQLTCVLPFTPYEPEALLVHAAFTYYLATEDGQRFAAAMIAELP